MKLYSRYVHTADHVTSVDEGNVTWAAGKFYWDTCRSIMLLVLKD